MAPGTMPRRFSVVKNRIDAADRKKCEKAPGRGHRRGRFQQGRYSLTRVDWLVSEQERRRLLYAALAVLLMTEFYPIQRARRHNRRTTLQQALGWAAAAWAAWCLAACVDSRLAGRRRAAFALFRALSDGMCGGGGFGSTAAWRDGVELRGRRLIGSAPPAYRDSSRRGAPERV